MKKLVLASASPRRAHLLSQLGLEFSVFDAGDAEEINFLLPPAEFVKNASMLKAEYAAQCLDCECVILAADTIVSIGGEILLKPKDEDDAFVALSKLSGRIHEVFTGFVLLCGCSGEKIIGVEKTLVRFRPLSEEQILAYIKSGEPFGKSGSYAVQGRGAGFVAEIYGDYSNVVGLPIFKISRLLDEKFGITAF